ncbi:MAG: methyltransferase domain-containing protein [Candidatus Binataceae bacterium]
MTVPRTHRDHYHVARELWRLTKLSVRSAFSGEAIRGALADIEEYETLLHKYCGQSLSDSSVLEIGFGARPNRMFAMLGLGIDVIGIDIEKPLLRFGPQNIWSILRDNGVSRALKSAVRFSLCDVFERRQLRRSLYERGGNFCICEDRFLVLDAAQAQLPDESFDLIISEDVFEHLRPESLPELSHKMARWLKPGGLALIRPNIFTGITGGHLTEWFPQLVDDTRLVRISKPWEHLRERRFDPTGYLNELTRNDFRSLFAKPFTILTEYPKYPDLGRQYLNDQVAAELRCYRDEELFSNQVMFVMTPRPGPALSPDHQPA